MKKQAWWDRDVREQAFPESFESLSNKYRYSPFRKAPRPYGENTTGYMNPKLSGERPNVSHVRLVDTLIASGVLKTPEIISAIYHIDRWDFVRDERKSDAYLDIPLPIGEGQTISQPFTVAYMLELLQPQPGDHVLDIGFGSGWQTALLAHIVGEEGQVTALEIIPELCEWGKRNVAKYNFVKKGIVDMHCMSGLGGYPERAPFDKVIAAAAGETVPDAWLEQTKIGGRIVTPIGSSVLQLIKKSDTKWERHDHFGFAFVPLVKNVNLV